jgi:hypothetical protein
MSDAPRGSARFIKFLDWLLGHCLQTPVCKNWGCDMAGHTCKGIAFAAGIKCTGYHPVKE